jgi:hypothetical protein
VRRSARIVAIACLGGAALVAPSGAQAAVDPNMICPDMFFPVVTQLAPPGTDKNGNFIVCAKPADGIVIWRDDLLKP